MKDSDLVAVEKDAINELIRSTPVEVRHASYVWFVPSELSEFFNRDVDYHTNRVLEFLLSNEFIKLRSYRPEYELMDKGKTLFRLGSIQGYYEMENNKNFSIRGDNNIVNVTHNGDISQTAVGTGGLVANEVRVPSYHLHSSIILPQKSAIECGCLDFFCWTSQINLGGRKLSAQKIFEELTKYRLDEVPMSDFKRHLLFLLDSSYRTTISRSEIIFQEPLRDAGATNHYKERAIRLAQNTIEYQFAQYKSGSRLITDLNEEFMPLLAMIYFCKSLYEEGAFDVKASIVITTNKDVQFMYAPQGIFSVEGLNTSTYLFDEGTELVERNLVDTDNATIIELMQNVAEQFVADSKYAPNPYLLIDKDSQNLALNYIKKRLNL